MLNERRRRVLSALVEEYIVSATPVGSRTLVDRYELGCSPATVRNELSILEETGYLVQPHVSAGRMPTDTGYRDFVDRLLEHLDATETSPAALAPAAEIDDLMREASAMLTRLTDSLAVVLAPSVSLARVKRVDLLSMAPKRALFVLITESGQVLNRHLELAEAVTPERLAEVERALNASLDGKRADQIRPLREALLASGGGEADGLLDLFLGEILSALQEADRDRLFHVGVPALLAQPEFHDADRARPVIETVEDGLAILSVLSDALSSERLSVRIGHENRRAELGGVSIVATHYGTSDSDGVVAVIGPTRMDYGRAIGAVRTVAEGLSDSLS